jgi:hypothetical protein
MSAQLSPLESLDSPALDRIAFFVGTSSFLGPAPDLLALISTSRTLYEALAFTANKDLWAKIFKSKFDTAAAGRRLSERWATAPCLAEEGRKRFAAMKRIRHGVVAEQHQLSDLWTAYIMLLESDGLNESQLIDWANIRPFLYRVIIYRARTPRERSSLWFSDTEGTALTVWLLWMTASAGKSLLYDVILSCSVLR